MNYQKLFIPALMSVLGLTAVAMSVALAQSSGDAESAEQPEFQLPPGWTQADLQAMIQAGTPGKEHEFLAKGVGEWHGKTTMWMFPGAEPISGECTSTVTPIMDGRYLKGEMEGEMPGMGPYNGFGIYGFDNVSQKFVSTWIDNHSTGIMHGTGEQSEDGKTIAWTFGYHCPVTNKPTVMREIETITGPDTKTLEMFGAEPKSGKEYQMMRIEFTRKER